MVNGKWKADEETVNCNWNHLPFTIYHLPFLAIHHLPFATSSFTIRHVKPTQLLITLGLGLLAVSCGGALYKVKPVVDLPALPTSARTVSGGGMRLSVAPLLNDEDSQELFEANLPLSGVLPVRVALNYESGIPLELKRARFSLRDAQGQAWKPLTPKQAVSRILKANGVFAYNPNSRKQFEQDFGAYGLDLKAPLSETDRTRQGFLFFATPNNEPVSSSSGLILKLERVPQPLELPLN